MKAILAAILLVVCGSSLAEDYVILKVRTTVKAHDGTELQLNLDDTVLFAGKNDTGAWVKFTVAGLDGSIPWDFATIINSSPSAQASYKGTAERLIQNYREAVAIQEAARARRAADAAYQADKAAILADQRMRRQQLDELARIREQLELLNLQRR